MENCVYGRSNIGELPGESLPFYARSVGHKVLSEGEREFSPDIRNTFVELIWSGEGIGEVILYGKAFQLNPNDVFYYLPNEDHFIRAISSEWKCRWVCFDGALAEAVFLAFKYPRHHSVSGNCPVELFEDLEQNISVTDPFQVRRMPGIILQILSMIGGCDRNIHSGFLPKRCIELVKANLSNPELNVNMLCDILQAPRSTLTKIFTEKMGISPGTYIRQMRLVHARSLLNGTDLSISEVASRCGITHLSSFSRFIRQDTGVGPQEYRKQRK